MLVKTKISVGHIHKGHLLCPGYSIFCKNTGNGHTSPLSFSWDHGNTISDSLKLQAEYPFIGMKDINKPMDSLSYLQHDVSAVFDNPCGNIKEPVSQCLD